jgi:hypothetical protein
MLADLKKSGLGAKDAAALGLEHSEPDGRTCYAIPYLALDGKATGHYRVRYLGALHELPKDKKGRPIRYSQPEGTGCHFYYPHIGGMKWKKTAADPSAALWITEGEKKAAALCRLGVPCIGLGGVFNWLTDGQPIEDFDAFKWKGRTVRIAFDSDIGRKPSVQQALKRLADELINRGAVPFSVELPTLKGADKTGADDFLTHNGSGAKALKAFRALPERSLLAPANLTFADLAKQKLPAQRWVVEGLIPDGLTMLAGPPKVGKSWFTLNLSVAVAEGGKVLGTYEARRGSVLHLALEDNARRFQERLRRMLDGKAAPGAAYFFNEWRKVEDHGLTALRSKLDQIRDTRLVVIDTLAMMRKRMTKGGLLYLDDYDAIRPFKDIADEYGVGVLLVHHTRKAAADDPLDQVSGSTGLAGAADTVLVLRKDYRQEETPVVTLHVRGRDVEEQQLALEMDQKTMVWRSLGQADAHRMGEERKQIVDLLVRRGEAATPSEVAELIGKKRGAVRQMMLRMANQGYLRHLPGGRYELKKRGADEKK